jgi:sigma-E factor negative regulatory protein RseA
MSEQIREQVSAFLDGELPSSETELLLKRLTRDSELRESFGRYALIGECVRGGQERLSRGFAERVNRAIDGEPAVTVAQPARSTSRWWRPLGGAAVAASVAVVAVIALQQRATVPGHGIAPITAQNIVTMQADGGSLKSKEPASYTVPPSVSEAPTALPAARLTNYVFAHSKYSSVMGQNDVLNDLLSTTDAEESAGSQKAAGTRAAP